MVKDLNDDLPENIKKAIDEMMRKFREISPEERSKMLGNIFGPEILDQVKDLFEKGGIFSFTLDPKTLDILDNLMTQFNNDDSILNYDFDVEEEPYYEIFSNTSEGGEIIFDLPGIVDIRQIEWYVYENELFLYSIDTEVKYKTVIPIPEYFVMQDHSAVLRNGVFILPYVISDSM